MCPTLFKIPTRNTEYISFVSAFHMNKLLSFAEQVIYYVRQYKIQLSSEEKGPGQKL